MQINLRPHQTKGIADTRQLLHSGIINILISAPTGCGKTVMAAYLVQLVVANLKPGQRVCFIVDRLSLVDQTSEAFDTYGIDHGVMQGDHPRTDPSKAVQICSVQTVSARGWPKGVKMLIIDECHTVTQTVKEAIEKRKVIAIGLTATPFASELKSLYDGVVSITTTNTLIRDGFLAPYRIYECEKPDMAGVEVVAGEFEESETARRCIRIVKDVVRSYIEHGENRKFICSAVNGRHVEKLREEFERQGVHVGTYTYKDSRNDRVAVTKEFRKTDSKIRGLITVTAASKGFDQPDVACIIAARPLAKSLAEHIQLLGRGLRTSPHKSDCIVLCHSGNCSRFYDDMEFFFEYGVKELGDGGRSKKKYKKRCCPKCKLLHGWHHKTCPGCGHSYEREEEPILDKPTGLGMVEFGAAAKARWPDNMWNQLCLHATRKHPDPVRAKKLALVLYRKIIGVWPSGNFEQTPLPDSIDKAVLEEIGRQNNEFFAKLALERGSSTVDTRGPQCSAAPTHPW